MPITNLCPYCHEPMTVTRMSCHGCHVSVDASFPSPRLMNLPSEHQRFIEIFILAGGNLKLLAEQAGVSYPTVRSRLDKVIDALRQEIARTSQVRGTILDAVDHSQAATNNDAKDTAAKIIKAV
jgi:hypothetical protein